MKRRLLLSDGSGSVWTILRQWPTTELEGRFLRVITLDDKVTIHNAFLDRRFKP